MKHLQILISGVLLLEAGEVKDDNLSFDVDSGGRDFYNDLENKTIIGEGS